MSIADRDAVAAQVASARTVMATQAGGKKPGDFLGKHTAFTAAQVQATATAGGVNVERVLEQCSAHDGRIAGGKLRLRASCAHLAAPSLSPRPPAPSLFLLAGAKDWNPDEHDGQNKWGAAGS